MIMGILRIGDVVGEAAEIRVLTNRTGVVKAVVSIDFDPDDCDVSMMHYTPEQARKLAAALIMAAEEAEKQ
ncbi:hypothetical protein A54_112 [Septuagintavirus sv54]|uniref:Uncharacterized protein n=1 Tax=Escherichia phage A5-4 TaxID=2996162 RepID=A0AAE9PXW7_9CAUD|nr:hypothetical protein A54_112 [Escherichia phage A5-4]